MKTNRLILASLAFAAALTSSFAQSTVAVTDPVGYVTMPIVQAAGAAPGVSFIGATLYNSPELKGTVAVAGSGTTVTLPQAAGPYGLNSINQPLYFFEITSGANEGKWTDIASITGSALTLVDPIGSLVTVGTSFTIRKHHTFNSLLGSTEAGLALHAGLDTNSADEVQILVPGAGPTSYYFSTDDLGTVGWINVKTALPAGDEVIAPNDGLKVIRRNPAVKASIVQTGHVKLGKTQFPIEAGTNIVTVPLATGFVANDASYAATGLLGGIDLGSADVLETFLNGAPTSNFLSTDDLAPGIQPGTFTAAEGTAVRIKRQAGVAFNLVFPGQVVQP